MNMKGPSISWRRILIMSKCFPITFNLQYYKCMLKTSLKNCAPPPHVCHTDNQIKYKIKKDYILTFPTFSILITLSDTRCVKKRYTSYMLFSKLI